MRETLLSHKISTDWCKRVRWKSWQYRKILAWVVRMLILIVCEDGMVDETPKGGTGMEIHTVLDTEEAVPKE